MLHSVVVWLLIVAFLGAGLFNAAEALRDMLDCPPELVLGNGWLAPAFASPCRSGQAGTSALSDQVALELFGSDCVQRASAYVKCAPLECGDEDLGLLDLAGRRVGPRHGLPGTTANSRFSG